MPPRVNYRDSANEMGFLPLQQQKMRAGESKSWGNSIICT